jgi:SET domain-containing protein
MFNYRAEVKVATNPKMGLGLFAKEFIEKGSIVWQYIEGVDVRISKENFEKLNEAQKEYVYKYAWLEEDGCYHSSCDLTNFINHSYSPNLDNTTDVTIALKDIQPGEELFTNYAEFDPEFDDYKMDFY